MSIELESHTPAGEEAILQYRAVSTAAVVSVVLAAVSISIIPAALGSVEGALVLCPLPLVGIFVGVRALLKIRGAPQAYTGLKLAWLGTVGSAGLLIGGLVLAAYVYVNELPPGYARVTFSELEPDEDELAHREVVPADILALDGQKIFIKGYMRPPSQTFQTDNFLLVRDNQECCFGKNLPAYFDRVQVHLLPPRRTDYARRLFRAGGTLKIDPAQARPGATLPVFTLVADHLK